jgi:hypothetical protein
MERLRISAATAGTCGGPTKLYPHRGLNHLRRGVFRGVGELTRVIEDYVALHNQAPKPFIWTATATDMLKKVKRNRAKLLKMQLLDGVR